MAKAAGRALRTLSRWTTACATVGFVLGGAAMFARVSPFVDAGSSSRSLRRYAIWIPIMTGAGASIGLALGTIAAVAGAIGSAGSERSNDREV